MTPINHPLWFPLRGPLGSFHVSSLSQQVLVPPSFRPRMLKELHLQACLDGESDWAKDDTCKAVKAALEVSTELSHDPSLASPNSGRVRGVVFEGGCWP